MRPNENEPASRENPNRRYTGCWICISARCPHNEHDPQFCIFCLRRHGDHLGELADQALTVLGDLDFGGEGGICTICRRHDPRLWREFGTNCCPRECYGHKPDCPVVALKKKLSEALPDDA